jgi:hypothetical protein
MLHAQRSIESSEPKWASYYNRMIFKIMLTIEVKLISFYSHYVLACHSFGKFLGIEFRLDYFRVLLFGLFR